ncbi:MAG TPA: hypothetical protein VIK28_04445 [Sedimentisphaerales bacterium]
MKVQVVLIKIKWQNNPHLINHGEGQRDNVQESCQKSFSISFDNRRWCNWRSD